MQAIDLLNPHFVYFHSRRILSFFIHWSVSPAIILINFLSKKMETLDASEYFSGKNVVLIGPNSEPFDEIVTQVKKADILVVINKGHRSKQFVELRPFAKEIVLFHCLDLSEETGGGGFSTIELRKKGFHAIFYPLCEDRFSDNISQFHRRNFSLLRLHRISNESYKTLQSTILGYTPNSGYAAIWSIAKGNCASLYISGINFMRNPYLSNYHSHLTNHQAAISLIEQYGNHNPDLDLDSFRELYKNHNIQVDNTLTEILSRPTERLFYLKR